jgi:hypothetical protein
MQGGDKMCCSLAGYSNKMACLCCKCNIKGEESGDPFVQCKQMSMIKTCALVDSNNVVALQAINQYNVHSASGLIWGMVVINIVFSLLLPQWKHFMYQIMG